MKTVTLLKKLISIPSFVDSNTNESQIVKYIQKYFKSKGYIVKEQKVEKERKNILCGNLENPDIVLLGHMDTVLPNEKLKNPLEPNISGDKLYGLGAVDMKAGIAIMLSLAKKNISKKIAYIFTCDEEYEFKGAIKIIEKYTWNPKIIVNLEPTGLQICNGCRGITEFSFDVFGKSAHASRKFLGVNAIEKSVKLVQILERRLQGFDKEMKTSINLSGIAGGVLKSIENSQLTLSKLGMVVPNFARINCEIRVGNEKINESFIRENIKTISKEEKVKIRNVKFKFFLGTYYTQIEKLNMFEKSLLETSKFVALVVKTVVFK